MTQIGHHGRRGGRKESDGSRDGGGELADLWREEGYKLQGVSCSNVTAIELIPSIQGHINILRF